MLILMFIFKYMWPVNLKISACLTQSISILFSTYNYKILTLHQMSLKKDFRIKNLVLVVQ